MGKRGTGVVSPETQALARYMSRAPGRRLPEAVAEKAKHHILDTLAAAVSGSRLRPGRAAIAHVGKLGGSRAASVIGSTLLTDVVNAALANGISAHADETDDSHNGAFIHPGCAVVPAALAVAEQRGAGGAAFLRAVVLGYDVGCRLTRALDVQAFSRAARSTHGFGGTFGAGAAAGALFGFDARRMRHLLSYLAQSASGCRSQTRDPSHMEKAFDLGGRPAQAGALAAALVAAGFAGVDDVFTGERNFLHAYSPSPHLEALSDALGRRYEIMGTTLKKWCVGSPIQAALDCIESLRQKQPLRAEEIARVEVHITPSSARTVDNAGADDINLQHLVALMIADGGLTFASCHDPARVRDPRVAAMRRRVRLIPDENLPDSRVARHAIVEVTLQSGRKLRRRTDAVRGTPKNPMSGEEVIAKARDLMDPVLGAARARRLVATVMTIEALGNVRRMRPLTRPRRPE